MSKGQINNPEVNKKAVDKFRKNNPEKTASIPLSGEGAKEIKEIFMSKKPEGMNNIKFLELLLKKL